MIARIKHIIQELLAFFPVQLLVNNFKKNQILLLFWVILFAIVTQNFGKHLGIPYLFLDPEYLDIVSHKGMFIIGMCFALFNISFFITSYILDSHRFPFLGTLKFPFITFCFNNSFFPILFTIVYLYEFVNFQSQSGLENVRSIVIQSAAFLAGTFFTSLIILMYFRYTNRKHVRLMVSDIDQNLKRRKINAIQILKKIKQKKRYKIRHYLSPSLSPKKVDHEFYIDKEELFKIIDQHHLNAVSVESVVFACILITGVFRDNPIFQIPAAASGLLFFSFFIMFTGAFSYWLRGWAITGIIALILGLNFLVKNNVITSTNQAYGIDYSIAPADYSLNRVNALCEPDTIEKDRQNTLKILDRWRAKFPKDKPPKMVLICSSGGGQRSAAWTFHALQTIDNLSQNNLMNQTVLMTGASGGLIGASYYRELYYQQKLGRGINTSEPKYYNDISKDILNPLVFSMVVSDLFLRFQKFEMDGYTYYRDRGYTFEQKLSQNIDGILNKKLRDYKKPEEEAVIPMVFIAPTIINDGRKLYISPQPISYMNIYYPGEPNLYNERTKGIELGRFFREQNAENVTFLSALRMSATFPYITPNVTLPSNPKMEIMDAGLIDNFGVKDVLHFMFIFKDWIEENTSGVVVLSIRDKPMQPKIEQNTTPSIWNNIFNPIGGLINNWEKLQDLNNDNLIEFGNSFIDTKFDVINIVYDPKPEDFTDHEPQDLFMQSFSESYQRERASLSWHLTQREKEGIKNYIHSQQNKSKIQELLKLIE